MERLTAYANLMLPMFLAYGCTFVRTQTVVEIRADARVAADADEVRIEVRNASDVVILARTVYPRSADFVGFPLTVPISTKNAAARGFELRAVAVVNRRQADGTLIITTLAQNRVRAGFQAGAVTRFSLWLLSGCRCNVETERCEPDADRDLVPECVPIDLAPSTLVDSSVADSGVDAQTLTDASVVDGNVTDGATSETGVIEPTCRADQHLCDGRCVALSSPLFCGSSCSVCPVPVGGSATCDNNNCGIVCAARTPDPCRNASGETTCVDRQTDRQHCGVCGRACVGAQLCQDGGCVEPPECDPTQDTCAGLSYCNATTRRCTQGCNGRAGQCASERMCDVQAHGCICRSDLTACGDACVTCPSGGAISQTGCSANRCVATSCRAGYQVNANGTDCIDINECLTNNGGCAANVACTNTPGGRSCGACPSGYTGNGESCSDINECLTNNGGCAANVVCTNTPGGRSCGTCPSGYTGNGESCSDTNECLTSNGGCAANVVCTNTPGARSCGACPSGYTGDGESCSDINECLTNNGGCAANVACTNTPGGRSCGTCPSGYTGNGESCTDINECLTNNGGCHANATCTNTAGARTCSCNQGHTGNGLTCVPMVLDAWQVDAFIKASNTGSYDEFGYSVALSGDGNTLAVGAYSEDSSGTGINSTPNEGAGDSGAVYVFARIGSTWSQQAFVKASNARAGDYFGWSVALSSDGNTLAVGAFSANDPGSGIDPNSGAYNSGAAYVFARTGSTWSQQASVQASNSGANDYFGHSVALSADGNTLASGARGEDSSGTGINSTPNEAATDSGAVYVFTRVGSTWSQQAFVKASNTGSYDEFGYSVAFSGDGETLAVGAVYENSSGLGINSTPNDGATDSGAVYVFAHTGGTWTQQAFVKASNTGADDQFGISVALCGDGNILAVGARGEDSSGTGINSAPNEAAAYSGAAYVFTRAGSTWSEQAFVKASNTGSGDYFGNSVALSADGSTLAVGAGYEDSSGTGNNSAPNEAAVNSGAAYVFTRTGSPWGQHAFVKASNTGALDSFGRSLALSADGHALVVGATREDSSEPGVNSTPNEDAFDSGAVYTYRTR